MSVKIQCNIDAVLKEAEERVERALRVVGKVLVDSAKRHCPVDTGNLQSSIKAEHERLKVRVGTEVHYGGYVEGGTEKMAAQPYLRPALHENLKAIERLFEAKT